MNTPRLEDLREAIETMHKCKARHWRTSAVTESFQGKTLWEGYVEAFDLEGHPTAKRCYAWRYEEKGERQYATVLELPPVCSPETAVQAVIAQEAKRRLGR